MAIADFGAGVQASLQQMVAQRQEQEELARRAQLDQLRLELQRQGLAQDASQFDATHGLNLKRLDEDTRQFDAGAPERDATTGYLRMQTRHMEEAPLRAEAGRQAQEARDKALHGYEMQRIGEQGRQGRLTVEAREAAKPQPAAQGPSDYAIETARRTIAAVDDVLPRIGNTTAGVGSILSKIPGTEAANVSADLSAVASNVAFNALQAMREASRTGGALGQVSERELDLLSSVEGSIRQNQSPENLRHNLLKIKESQQRWLAAAGLGPMSSHGGGPSKPTAEELIRKYGG